MKKVFISHPYSDNPIENIKKVDRICKELTIQGVLAISPLHLFSYMESDRHREDIMQACIRVISICDEVWIYGNSKGCKIEERAAKAMGIRVVNMYGKEPRGQT